MFDDDICKLDTQASHRTLDGLEASIWMGVTTRTEATRHARLVYSCQTVVLVLGLIVSIMAGTFAAAPDSSNNVVAFAATPDLAPSSRLIGR